MINQTTSSTKTSTMSNGDGLRLLAPAKINLALEILRRRPDGFHEIATVMTTLDLAWKAHKMRNDVAHSGEKLPLSERDVRSTIDYYKRVFEEFGAI